jgi:hypothetical protein
LVTGDGGIFVLGLPFLEKFFEFGVGGEIYGLVAAWRAGSKYVVNQERKVEVFAHLAVML